MYESHFGLLRRPFLATPDPDCFATLESIENALAGLALCAAAGQGFGILSAPAGTGKTLVCRKLIDDLRDRLATVYLAHSNFPTRRSLLQAILYELGHPYIRMSEQELRLELRTAVTQVSTEKEAVLLVVDEAHLLNNQLLEEIRTIANLEEGGVPLIRVVLSGQLALEETLAGSELEALNQRIACQVTIEPLTRSESADYVAHRLQWAGADMEDVFRAEALQIICHAADGLPRCLNQLCDHALLLAYVSDERPAEAATVREALEDLKQLPLHWNDPPPISSPAEPFQQGAGEASVEEQRNVEDCIPSMDVHDLPGESFEVGAIEMGEVGTIEPGEAVETDAESLTAETAIVEVGATQSEVVVETPETSTLEIGSPAVSADEQIAGKDEPVTVEAIEVGDVGLAAGEFDASAAQSDNVDHIESEPIDSAFAESASLSLEPKGAAARTTLPVPHADLIGMPSLAEFTPTAEPPAGFPPEFDEELVVDRYASLDAGISMAGDGLSGGTDPIDPFTVEQATATPATVLHESLGSSEYRDGTQRVIPTHISELSTVSFGDDLLLARTPEQLIDEIQPIISDALTDANPFDGQQHAIADQETVNLPVTDDKGPPTTLRQEFSSPEPDDCVTAEQAAGERAVAELEQLATETVGANQYDVVQPEESGSNTDARREPSTDHQPSSNESAAVEESSGPAPRGRYAHLFSQLRRRQQQNA